MDVPLSRASLSGMYPTGVHPIGMHLMGVHPVSVHLLGVRACISQAYTAKPLKRRLNYFEFLNVNYSTFTILFVTRVIALYSDKFKEFFNIFLKILGVIDIKLILFIYLI